MSPDRRCSSSTSEVEKRCLISDDSRLGDDDMGDVVRDGEGEDLVKYAAAGKHGRFRAQALGGAQGLRQPVAVRLGELERLRRLDMQDRPRSVQAFRHAAAVAHERASPPRTRVDADENALAGCPGAGDGIRLHVRQQLLVDALRGATQGELAKCRQIALRKIAFERPATPSRECRPCPPSGAGSGHRG